MQIIIQPIEKDINNNILNLLSNSISAEFNNVDDVIVAPTLKVDVQKFIDRNRNDLTLSHLLHCTLERIKPTKEMKVLSICDIDAYSGNLNFVFGEASLGGQVAAIYLPRLRPEFYNLEH